MQRVVVNRRLIDGLIDTQLRPVQPQAVGRARLTYFEYRAVGVTGPHVVNQRPGTREILEHVGVGAQAVLIQDCHDHILRVGGAVHVQHEAHLPVYRQAGNAHLDRDIRLPRLNRGEQRRERQRHDLIIVKIALARVHVRAGKAPGEGRLPMGAARRHPGGGGIGDASHGGSDAVGQIRRRARRGKRPARDPIPSTDRRGEAACARPLPVTVGDDMQALRTGVLLRA